MYFSKIVIALAVPSMLAVADPEITALMHDKVSGKTTLSWESIAPENGVVVYRSSRNLDGDELFFAQKYIFPAGTKQGSISVSGSGKFYYRIAELTPHRRIVGKLSSERSIEETDRSIPALVEYTLERQGNKAMFKAVGKLPDDAVKLLLLYRKDPQDTAKTLASVPADKLEIALPEDLKHGFAALAVADSDGNYTIPERWFYCGMHPDFSINGSPLVSQNKDVALSDRFMTVGKSSKLSFTIRNNGGAAGKARVLIQVADKSGVGKELYRKDTVSVAPGEKTVVSVDYMPEKAGKVELALKIISKEDINPADNQLKLPLYNLNKELYILWYGGNVMDLEYANYASVHADDRAEFIRRGGKNLATSSRTTNPSGEDYFKRIKSAGAVGMQLDEIGGRIKASRFLPAIVDLESRHPEVLSAVWHIGYTPQPEVIQALKERKIDLIMPEIYYKDGTPEEQQKALNSLRARLEKLRKTGVAEYMLIGLGTHRNYLGWGGSPDKHARFIEEQIKLVREILPMTPGIAFYSSDADTAFLKQVDEMCRKYFLENER